MKLAFDNQIYRRQPKGGISRYFNDLINALGVDPDIEIVNRQAASVVHATFYGGKPYKPKRDRLLVSSLFDMTPELHPEHFALSRFRSPHANKLEWLRQSAGIISISQASADDLCFFDPTLSSRVEVIHLATQMDKVTPDPIPELLGKHFWLMVGKRRSYKNALTLYRALQRLNQPGREPTLLVVAGGEPWGKRDQRWIQTEQLMAQIIPVKANDMQLAWLYRHAAAVLIPSIAEGFSLPLIEAFVCNAPVIASDLEAHREVAGSFATFVPALNAAAWAEILSASLSQRLQQPKQILGAKEYDEKKHYYGLGRMVARHKDVYSRLMASWTSR